MFSRIANVNTPSSRAKNQSLLSLCAELEQQVKTMEKARLQRSDKDFLEVLENRIAVVMSKLGSHLSNYPSLARQCSLTPKTEPKDLANEVQMPVLMPPPPLPSHKQLFSNDDDLRIELECVRKKRKNSAVDDIKIDVECIPINKLSNTAHRKPEDELQVEMECIRQVVRDSGEDDVRVEIECIRIPNSDQMAGCNNVEPIPGNILQHVMSVLGKMKEKMVCWGLGQPKYRAPVLANGNRHFVLPKQEPKDPYEKSVTVAMPVNPLQKTLPILTSFRGLIPSVPAMKEPKETVAVPVNSSSNDLSSYSNCHAGSNPFVAFSPYSSSVRNSFSSGISGSVLRNGSSKSSEAQKSGTLPTARRSLREKKVVITTMEKSHASSICPFCDKVLCTPFSMKRHAASVHKQEVNIVHNDSKRLPSARKAFQANKCANTVKLHWRSISAESVVQNAKKSLGFDPNTVYELTSGSEEDGEECSVRANEIGDTSLSKSATDIVAVCSETVSKTSSVGNSNGTCARKTVFQDTTCVLKSHDESLQKYRDPYADLVNELQSPLMPSAATNTITNLNKDCAEFHYTTSVYETNNAEYVVLPDKLRNNTQSMNGNSTSTDFSRVCDVLPTGEDGIYDVCPTIENGIGESHIPSTNITSYEQCDFANNKIDNAIYTVCPVDQLKVPLHSMASGENTPLKITSVIGDCQVLEKQEADFPTLVTTLGDSNFLSQTLDVLLGGDTFVNRTWGLNPCYDSSLEDNGGLERFEYSKNDHTYSVGPSNIDNRMVTLLSL